MTISSKYIDHIFNSRLCHCIEFVCEWESHGTKPWCLHPRGHVTSSTRRVCREQIPGHTPVVQALLASELHHEALLQVLGPHFHNLPIRLLHTGTKTQSIKYDGRSDETSVDGIKETDAYNIHTKPTDGCTSRQAIASGYEQVN